MEMVILVDENDSPRGTMEKMDAHRKGELHRAFSVMVENSKGDMLLQRRAAGKYHSAGLWTNACCSHPQPGEKVEDAARRRLQEEMGIDRHPVFVYKFIYRAELDRDLIEHELDHVFVCTFDGQPRVNPDEVSDWKYVTREWLLHDIHQNPAHYTYWFRMIVQDMESKRIS